MINTHIYHVNDQIAKNNNQRGPQSKSKISVARKSISWVYTYETLQNVYPELYQLATKKEVTVAAAMEGVEPMEFRRNLSETQIRQLMEQIHKM